MINRQAQRESFILRIWREKGQSEWKGWVQHIHSGDSAPLESLQELMPYLERWTAKSARQEKQRLK
jgi:hypothetical protein